jgi:putative glutamine amidotransferase
LRHGAVVTARALSAAVLRAGGEPLTCTRGRRTGSSTPPEVAERLAFADGVLVPGGGDLAPSAYGEAGAHDEVYDVDAEQDAFDLAAARWALDSGVPLLAICRGTQVVNVALGGGLEQHMAQPHRHRLDRVRLEDAGLAQLFGADVVEVSCYHHQYLSRLGDGLQVAARADDGTIEAVTAPGRPGSFLGVQWHPEDTAPAVPGQQGLFDLLVAAAADHRSAADGAARGARPVDRR